MNIYLLHLCLYYMRAINSDQTFPGWKNKCSVRAPYFRSMLFCFLLHCNCPNNRMQMMFCKAGVFGYTQKNRLYLVLTCLCLILITTTISIFVIFLQYQLFGHSSHCP